MIDKLFKALGISSDNLVNQPGKAPTRKAGAALLAGVIAAVLDVLAVNYLGDSLDPEVSGWITGAIIAVVSFVPGLGAYLTKESGT